MLLLAAVVLGVATVPLGRGRLSALANVRLRFVPAIFAALAIQIAITTVLPDGSPWAHRVLHVLSYALAATFLVANRRIAGMWVIALGTTLNALAILANNGVMPASKSALRAAGMTTSSHGFANSSAVTHPHLLPLGDVLAVPASWPLHNVYSVGDICIAVGVVITIHALSRSANLHPAPANPDTSLRKA